ncbi:flavin reductase family protein [Cognatishimia activa]|uniref:flavin reductase family protein n=1 Tax=Cognatishimia activa TaxID=1715691 RepID=UPI002231AD6A|nr:flavin reductase family protein [Cognatishimia activa]UZD92475.1 flavin reductase family protein [Cognatishimia activa]
MGQSFLPTKENQRALRDAFGCFATGVTVITTSTDTGPIGITANSFSSVSLDPPLISWCPAKESDRLSAFEANSDFAIHILREDQGEMATAFAENGDCFGDGWRRSQNGVPIYDDCLCVLECQREAQFDAGDHLIMLGRVHRVHMHQGQPLVFCHGKFGGFSTPS